MSNKKLGKILKITLICSILFSIIIDISPLKGFSDSNYPHYENCILEFEYYDASIPKNVNLYQSYCKPEAGRLELPKLPDGKYVPPLNKNGHPLNYRIWYQKGLVVYGTLDKISKIPGNTFRCGYELNDVSYYNDGYFKVNLNENPCQEHGKSCPNKSGNYVRGEFRYLGYDYDGNLFENINYIMENYTPIWGRKWIKDPWDIQNASKTNINAPSTYNRYVLTYDNQEAQSIKLWINNIMIGYGPNGEPAVPYITQFGDEFNKARVNYDFDVYRYMYIKSAPTIMTPGQGVMWHQRPSLVYPKSWVIEPLKEKKQLPVEAKAIPSNYLDKVADTELDKQTTFDLQVIGILKDEFIFQNNDEVDALRSVYYNSRDIKEWEFTINYLGKTYKQKIAMSNKLKNQQSYTFEKLPVTQRELNNGFLVSVSAQPIYENNVKGNIGYANATVKAGIIHIPEPKEEILVIIPTLNINNHIGEVAFDEIPFTDVYDNTDMSIVTNKTVTVGGVPVDYDYFFSGNYIFPKPTNRNGYITYVEVTYYLDKDALILQNLPEESKKKIESSVNLIYKSVDVVYVYNTEPVAHFKLASNTWKQNRIINLINDSTSCNTPIVMQHFPIVEYKWYYSNSDKLYRGIDTDLQKQLMYKEPGNYSITLQAKNTLGEWSEPFTYEFIVLEDYGPAIELNLIDSVITRNDEMSAWHYDVVSTDGDAIANVKIELWYDENNDGIAEVKLGEWDGFGENGIIEKEDFPKYKPIELGHYVYKIYAKEEFVNVPGQDTLDQYITDSDKKTSYYEVDWWVDNYQPLADIYINAPIQRPKVDLFIMLDKNLDDNKRQYILNERVTIENMLLSYNIIPNVNVWDMKTYEYSQPASTSRNTGTTYPPSTITYESNGYSGTLSLYNVENNGYYHDFGRFVSETESKTVSDYASQSGSFCPNCNPSGIPPTYSTGSKYYSDSQGYSGYLTCSYNYSATRSGKCSTCGHDITSFTRTWYWSGTVTRTVQVWQSDWRWVNDYKGDYSGTIYKYVRQSYTDPYSGGETAKYILYISDDIINELSDLIMVKNKSDAKLILAGDQSIKSQINYNCYINTQNKTIENTIGEVIEYIRETSPAAEEIYILQNEQFNFNLAFYDLENDEIIEQQLQYVHDANYFDNPTGQEAGTVNKFSDDSWETNIKNQFANVGKYTIYTRVKDKPKGNLGEFYSYYSGPSQLNIFVHRKPIANAELNWTYNPSTGVCETIWIDKSYDLDHTSKPNKGIVDRKIMFRRNSGEWQYYIPSTLIYGDYEVYYYVKDEEGVWSDPWIKTFTLDSNPQFSASARAKDSKFSLNSIPASEIIELYNIWTKQPSPVKLQIDMAKTASSNGNNMSTMYVEFTNGVTGNQNGQEINWKNVDVTIPDNFKDGETTLFISAVDKNSGSYTQIPFTVNIFTPIDLTSSLENKTLLINKANTINATTTKYVNTTTVQMQYGTRYQSSVLNMTGTLNSNQITWSINYTVPSNVPEGNYQARFVSTTPSGKQEVKLISYKVTHNTPPIANITGTNPSYIYEGDTLFVNFDVYDNELQELTYELRISGYPNVWTGVINPIGSSYPNMSIETIDKINTDTFTITLTVRDTYGASVTVTKTINVYNLTIDGEVKHTPDWDYNRVRYNNTSPSHKYRNENVFFPGEKFVLRAVTTDIDPQSSVYADRVKVTIQEKGLNTYLSKTSSNEFEGNLWDINMIHWPDQELNFIFEVTYSNGTVKTHVVKVYIVDDEYWRLHREF